MNPANGRIWTANARVIGGEGFAKLGFGGYDIGARAGRIRDRLLAQEQFAPKDFLSIQLDDVSIRNSFWQKQLLAELARHKADARLQALVEPVLWKAMLWPFRSASELMPLSLRAKNTE